MDRGGSVALAMIGCRVTLDGRPLAGAQVRPIPKDYVGDVLAEAEGTTNRCGAAMPTVAFDAVAKIGTGVRGVQPGIYRVEITYSGQHSPAKYHTISVLALAVSHESLGSDIAFALATR